MTALEIAAAIAVWTLLGAIAVGLHIHRANQVVRAARREVQR